MCWQSASRRRYVVTRVQVAGRERERGIITGSRRHRFDSRQAVPREGEVVVLERGEKLRGGFSFSTGVASGLRLCGRGIFRLGRCSRRVRRRGPAGDATTRKIVKADTLGTFALLYSIRRQVYDGRKFACSTVMQHRGRHGMHPTRQSGAGCGEVGNWGEATGEKGARFVSSSATLPNAVSPPASLPAPRRLAACSLQHYTHL